MATISLFTGLSGLRTHQRYLDVIGNNLANVSTPGYWASRATFSDILSFTMRSGSGPSGNFGGRNPMQIGLGAQIASIDLNTNQGTFQTTGRPLDVAIQGRGFFTLTDGLQNFYTRVGTFGVDSDRALVDLRTGHRVVSSSGGNITVPITDTLPPRATSSVTFQGNLPAVVTGPLQEILESSAAFLAGTAASKTATPPAGTTYDVSSFVGKTLLVSVDGGAKQTVTIDSTKISNPSAATATEIASLFANVSGITATPDAGTGRVVFDTIKLGSSATLKFDDGPGASGLLSALGLNATLVSGTQTAAASSTSLNSLTMRSKPYVAGDQITVSGTNPDGTAVSDTFVFGTGAGQDGTTLGDLINFLNATFDSSQATVSLQSDGTMRVTATEKKEADLSLFIGDAAGNTGSSNFPSFKVTQEGKGPDTATTSVDIVDAQGRLHPVTLTFTRTVSDPGVWDLKATMDSSEGSITSDTISSIRFNSDGSFNVIGGGTNTLKFAFNGIPTAQSITVNLGSSGKFDGVAMLGSKSTVAVTDQDGYGVGTLLNMAFNEGGELTGYYSNGQSKVFDTLRISVFPNEGGLIRLGDTLFAESPNSDDAIVTTAGASGAGVIRPGSLENSNVDIAEEFVNLIQAQRGFQASSRVITTADEILAELIGILR